MTAQQPRDATNPTVPVRDQLAAAQNAAETLSALNWDTYRCQCVHGHTCTETAGWVVHIHAIDACNQPGLDPCGNRVEIRCGSCVARLRTEVGEKLARLSPWGRPACQGCGAPIAAVSDVIRGVAQL